MLVSYREMVWTPVSRLRRPFDDIQLLPYSRIYYRLKYQKTLTNSVMQNVIGKVMDSVDFNGIYITEKTLKMLCKRCPNLKSLDLKTCEYLVTDTVLRWLLKVSKTICRLSYDYLQFYVFFAFVGGSILPCISFVWGSVL